MPRQLPFHSYKGQDPYVFISYAHKDDEKVFGIIKLIHERLFRIWYDEGIEVGANWPQMVAAKLLGSSVVLVFVSAAAAASQNCRREINYAVAQKKRMIAVYLDDSPVPEDIAMQLSVVDEVRYGNAEQTADEIAALLDPSLIGDGLSGYEKTEYKGKKKLNKWFVVSMVALVLLAGLAVYVVGSMNGWFSGKGITKQTVTTGDEGEVSITTFSDGLSMEILLKSLNSEYVYICGNKIVSSASAIKRDGSVWSIAGEPVAKGSIDKLSYFEDKEISQLVLVNQSLSDVSGIENLGKLEYLDLSGDPVADLTPLGKLSELKTLVIEKLPAGTDLSVLAGCPALKQVYVSYDMVDGIKPLVEAGIEVTVRR